MARSHGDFLIEPLISRLEVNHPFQAGDLVGERFRIVREIAEGGMGVVYEAIDEKLEQRRALKCAKPGHYRRLSPEARSALKVTHDNVCRVYEIHTAASPNGRGFCHGVPEGETAARLERSGPAAGRRRAKSRASWPLARLRSTTGNSASRPEGNNIMLPGDGCGQVRVVTRFRFRPEPLLMGDRITGSKHVETRRSISHQTDGGMNQPQKSRMLMDCV
jgi:hypothetical protein